jgi:hypothetical protein
MTSLVASPAKKGIGLRAFVVGMHNVPPRKDFAICTSHAYRCTVGDISIFLEAMYATTFSLSRCANCRRNSFPSRAIVYRSFPPKFPQSHTIHWRFIIRIEDTDQKRSSDAASVGFLKDLDWLGIRWDEGPEYLAPDGTTVGGGPNGSYFQSERLAVYNRYCQRLIDEGKAYEAWDSAEELEAMRKDAMARKEAFRYRFRGQVSADQRAQFIAEGRQPVVRFRAGEVAVTIHDEVLGDATLPAGEVDDFVIRKKDGFPTYHFAVVVDDELMGVTHVLRAQEHFTNTAKHMLLQDALGFRRPVYGHLSIIKNPDDSKMSKRDKDKVLRKAVKERALTAPPAGTVTAEEWSRWLGDDNIQLELEGAIRLGIFVLYNAYLLVVLAG